jgi:hypothetical protein
VLGKYRYFVGPDGPLLSHDQERDAVRTEVERWWQSDEHVFFKRRVERKEWSDPGVPRKVWKQVFDEP